MIIITGAYDNTARDKRAFPRSQLKYEKVLVL